MVRKVFVARLSTSCSLLFYLLWAFLPSSIALNAAQSGDFSALIIEPQPRPGDLIDADKTPPGPDQFALHFQSIPGKTYQIQSTEIPGSAWKSETTVTATTTQKRVLLNKSARNGFYRVLLVQ